MPNATALEAQVIQEYAARLPSPPAQGDYLLVLGPTSSGKTTTVRAFVEAHPEWVRVYDEALMSSPRFARYFEGTPTSPVDYLPFEVEALLVRFLQNLRCGAYAVADQSLHSIWAYARAVHAGGGLSDDHYQTIHALALTLHRLAPVPRFTVHFRCDPVVARDRLVERNRPHELRLATIDFLRALDEAYLEVIRELAPCPVMTIDTTSLTQDEQLRKFGDAVGSRFG